MNEVEALRLHAGEESGPLTDVNGVPAHVREYRRREALHRPGPLSETGGARAVLDSRGEQDLQTHADSEDRSSSRESGVDDEFSADSSEPRHAGRVRTNSWNDQCVARRSRSSVAGYLDVRADPLEGALNRAQISTSVVQHHDGLPRRCAHRRGAFIGRRSVRVSVRTP